MNATIANGRKTATVSAQNTGTDWVQIDGTPGSWCALPYSITATTSEVQLQRRAIGGSTVVVISSTDGSGLSAVPTLALADAYTASAGYEYRLWVPTGGYGNGTTLAIGA